VRGGSSSSRRIKYRALFTLPTVSRLVGHPPSYRINFAALPFHFNSPGVEAGGEAGAVRMPALKNSEAAKRKK